VNSEVAQLPRLSRSSSAACAPSSSKIRRNREERTLVVLDEIDGSGLRRFSDSSSLPRRFRLRAAVDLRNKEGLSAMPSRRALTMRISLAAIRCVPAVVEK